MGRQPLGAGACVCHNLSRSSPQIYRCSVLTSPLLVLSVPPFFPSFLPFPTHTTLGINSCQSIWALWSFIFFGLCACVSGWSWRRQANLTCGSLLLLAKDGTLTLSAQTRAAGPPARVSASQVTCSCTGLFGFWVFELSSTHLYREHFTL